MPPALLALQASAPMPAASQAIIAGERKYSNIPVPILAIYAIPHDMKQFIGGDETSVMDVTISTRLVASADRPAELLARCSDPLRAPHGAGRACVHDSRRDGRTRKPRRCKARLGSVSAVKIGVLRVHAGAEDVGLDLSTHVIESINASG